MIIQNISKTIKLSKAGKPYASVGIQFAEYRDGKGNMKWISGFGNKRTWLWKKGDDIEPEITEKNGYLNFSFAETEENRIDVYKLPASVGLVYDLLGAKKSAPNPNEGVDAPSPEPENQVTEDINPEDIPF